MDDFNLFDHLLEYQQTDDFIADIEAHKKQRQEQAHKYSGKASNKYRKNNPSAAKMRDKAQKHKQYLIEIQNNICAICGKELDNTIEIDHKKAITNNGTNELDNLQVVHRKCNRKKYNK